MKTGCNAKLLYFTPNMRKKLIKTSMKPMVPLRASGGYNGSAAVCPMKDIAHNF